MTLLNLQTEIYNNIEYPENFIKLLLFKSYTKFQLTRMNTGFV